ncbi:MAG: Rrf2 family transcriptional regulator [Anaerolineae bacterium]|nr:Rrf2 family transcriptional regulator [Anaerolineae bacterium]
MKLSKRGEYGLRAMIYLADPQRSGDKVQIKEIAAHEQIPVKYLEQILLSLKNVGLLQSRAGLGGGYALGRPAGLITLGEVIRVLDGPLAPIRCASQTAYEPCSCPDEETCGLRLVMVDVRQAVADIIDHTTLADVVERSRRAEQQKHNRLFTAPANRQPEPPLPDA